MTIFSWNDIGLSGKTSPLLSHITAVIEKLLILKNGLYLKGKTEKATPFPKSFKLPHPSGTVFYFYCLGHTLHLHQWIFGKIEPNLVGFKEEPFSFDQEYFIGGLPWWSND